MPGRLSGTLVDPEVTWEHAGTDGVISLLGAEFEVVTPEEMEGEEASIHFTDFYAPHESWFVLKRDRELRIPVLVGSAEVMFCSFDTAVSRLSEDRDLFEEVTRWSPREVLADSLIDKFGRPGYTILTAATCRVRAALYCLEMLLQYYEPSVNKPCWKSTTCHEYGLAECVRCPVHRTALLLRLFIQTHLDLLGHCTEVACDDKSLQHKSHERWLSPLEEHFPHGTRCKWLGTTPPLALVLESVHWFIKKPQHKSALMHCLQKVRPHKYVQRNWPTILPEACLSCDGMLHLTSEIILCSYVGGYPHATRFPNVPKATALFRGMRYRRTETVKSVLTENPAFVLFAWKEIVAAQIYDRDDLLAPLCEGYNWEEFSIMTVGSMNAIRQALGYWSDAGERVIALTEQLHEELQAHTSKRVLRSPFKSLACKHLDGMLREKVRNGELDAETSKPETAYVIPPRATFEDVLSMAGLPNDAVERLLAVEKKYVNRQLPDTAAKREINSTAAGLSCAQFLSLHRKLAQACSPFVPVLMPLSFDAAAAHVRVLEPEDRPMYICTTCGRVGATVNVLKPCGGKNGKYVTKTVRGLITVAYGLQTDRTQCGRKTKKPASARNRQRRRAAGDTEHSKLVPKHKLDELRGCTCGMNPMLCIDKRGYMIRINTRTLAACCTCGVMTELSPQGCIVTEPQCYKCAHKQLWAAAEKPEAGPTTCGVCSKKKPVGGFVCVLAFQDADATRDNYYRFFQLTMCREHDTDNAVVYSLSALLSGTHPRGKKREKTEQPGEFVAARDRRLGHAITEMKKRARKDLETRKEAEASGRRYYGTELYDKKDPSS